MSLTQPYLDLENTYCARNYHPLPVVLTRGEGVWLYDIDGNRYLDMMSGYSAVSFGHSHPKILQTLKDQASQLIICSRAFHTDQLGPFLKKLCSITKMDMALPMNTGAEAVETAIKAVRQWGYQVKKIPENKAEIIVSTNNFHGRTIGIISFSSEKEYKKDFGPFLPGFKLVPFGDMGALSKAITPYTCAVLTEPMQGEAGIVLPPSGWLKQVQQLCDEHKVLLAVDEVQTGLGRCGALLASHLEHVQPDLVILGKALGGGVFPVSAVVGTKDVMQLFAPGSHGSTFGGNPLAAAVGFRALEVLEEERLCEKSHQLGNYFLKELHHINSSVIKERRGCGLWIGLELHTSARQYAEQLAKEGLLTKDTHHTVIRLVPPLIITQEEIDQALEILKKVFH
ncbi:MAG: ornithine--oxo-acid transaminase [Proteobacteria bacterium]|nr:ornithine--oxo-acid transaminase [Pseudomonadota bacterium]